MNTISTIMVRIYEVLETDKVITIVEEAEGFYVIVDRLIAIEEHAYQDQEIYSIDYI
jgi:hypothetical protein